ncbi:Nuclear factor related to kappa-B-binding protein [Gracilariopsis chorda]|uniref:Nuclear factor related to kappa-B-binding protein n=1 Tax=Gracilariopsis chorda TaxID=448386 RepID=A0A2V3J2A3_9FLOR|nr:Nuclear factor related to kappa-B-binding protein [Gracilariopsis chorda]|eukprot:PXF48586.1 Nuclear factor related to kappa-B-binding protein [Gracilariopsis chorda]
MSYYSASDDHRDVRSFSSDRRLPTAPRRQASRSRSSVQSVSTDRFARSFSVTMPPRPTKRRGRGKPRPDYNAREATAKSLDMLGLSPTPVMPSAGKPPVVKRKGKKKVGGKRKADEDEGVASSGDEYTHNLLDTYIGQIGACCALGMKAGDVINAEAWERFSEEERESLKQHLPRHLPDEEKERVARMLVGGSEVYFGSPRERCFDAVAAGLTHPRVKRWRLRVTLIERRHHIMAMREYQNRSIRRLLARKACLEYAGDAMAGLAAVGGNLTRTGGALQALPNRIQATAEAAARSSIMKEWDADRWRRVLDFRNQETQRYMVPERAFKYANPWGTSIVGPLKRGPAIDGGRPREHVLLRNERPSHVTILCIVRDAASRLPNNRGTRADICDLLRDSQYVREGATFQQLNTVVSGALDRLHYEENAPVRYDAETKEWCYLHNDMNEEDFERPAWARETSQKQGAAVENAAIAVARSKPKKRKKRKMA